MNAPPKIQLCPHGMATRSCPTCYNATPPPARANRPAENGTQPGIQAGPVISMDQALASAAAAQQRSRDAVAKRGPVQGHGGPPLQREAYHEANLVPPPDAHSGDKVWTPPAHKNLIDAQPKHPHADKSQLAVLKRG